MAWRLATASICSFGLGWWACSRKQGEADDKQDQDEMPGPTQMMTAIKARRSIFPKDYTGEAPPRAHLEKMLEASNWAPTHGKTEPWRFVVLEKEGIAKFFGVCNDAMKKTFGEGSEKFLAYQTKQEKSKKDKAKSAYIIAICMKRKTLPNKLMPEWEEVAATACAVQNMHLMATSLGVASYWSSGGPIDDALVLDLLGLKEEGDRCLGLFYVGMATNEKTAGYRKGARRGPTADKVTWLSA